jgi:hypothetical protein
LSGLWFGANYQLSTTTICIVTNNDYGLVQTSSNINLYFHLQWTMDMNPIGRNTSRVHVIFTNVTWHNVTWMGVAKKMVTDFMILSIQSSVPLLPAIKR